MRTHFTPLKGALPLLLVVSGILFLLGSTIERGHRHHESAPPARSATTERGGESGNGSESGAESSTGHGQARGQSEAGAKILGVDTESTALSIVAVVLSLVLAGAVWLAPSSRLVLLVVIGFGLVFAAGDAREVAHQLNESNSGLAVVAAILIALHLAVAGLAALLSRPHRPPRAVSELT